MPANSAPLSAALITASLALVGKVLFDLSDRFRQRQAMAGALAGELGAYLSFHRTSNLPDVLITLADENRDTRREKLFGLPGEYANAHPVFDKIADKVGMFPLHTATEISRVYNVVTGARLLLAGLASDRFIAASDEAQRARLLAMARLVSAEIPRAIALKSDLEAIAAQSFWFYLWGYAND